MSLKYLTNLLLALGGGFLVVSSRTFATGTAGWLGLGIGIVAVLLALFLVTADRRALDRPTVTASVLTTLLGIWTIVSSTVFSGASLGWLVFADGLALVAVALVELTRHELSTERVVHTLIVSERQATPVG